jgi:hypothetical protein
MNKGVCVFDLDGTLGDLRVISFFGLLFEPKVIPNIYTMNDLDKKHFNSIINNYDDDMFDFMEKLRNTFEKEIHLKDLNEGVLRNDIKKRLNPLVHEFKKGNLEGFIIYSNNSNLYTLEYTGRAIEKLFNIKNLFIEYLDRNNDIRNEYDGPKRGDRLKMVDTIKLVLPKLKDKNILFMDDLIHNDFFKNENITYINVAEYTSNIPKTNIEEIWEVFESVFKSMPEEEQNKFFDLFHIKKYINANNLDDIKREYFKDTGNLQEDKNFKENFHMIDDKIRKFINNLNNYSGGKRTRKHKSRRRTYKSRRLIKTSQDEEA